jgi:hypothetical protein
LFLINSSNLDWRRGATAVAVVAFMFPSFLYAQVPLTPQEQQRAYEQCIVGSDMARISMPLQNKQQYCACLTSRLPGLLTWDEFTALSTKRIDLPAYSSGRAKGVGVAKACLAEARPRQQQRPMSEEQARMQMEILKQFQQLDRDILRNINPHYDYDR